MGGTTWDGEVRVIVGIDAMPKTAWNRWVFPFALGPPRVTAIFDAFLKVNGKGLDLPLVGSLAGDPAATDCLVVGSLDRRGRKGPLVRPYERRASLEGLEIAFKRVRAIAGDSELWLLQPSFEGVGQT
ncbi:MAG TPA: hypothetical protein VNN10_00335 [Dehalococcoidia bacterium]|nr:hypothetical protein [Dehalococcoidia bacterium]